MQGLTTVLLELPVSVVEWAYLTSLQPTRAAVEVESMLEMEVSRVIIAGRNERLTLQIPHATVHSSLVAEAWFA